MTHRVPETSLHRRLVRHHRACRDALVLRHALRAAAAICAVVAAAVAVGVGLTLGPGAAWTRLVLVVAAGLLALGFAVVAFLREAPGFDAWLEGAERRFPDLRSWLRNALDLESAPLTGASPVLARALTDETLRRLEGTPLVSLKPRLHARRPLIVLAGALGLSLALALLAPGGARRSWATLWDPAAAAPPVRLVVEPGSVRLTPGAALAVRARVWGTTRAPRLLRDGAAAVNATAEGGGPAGERVWRFDLTQLTREQDYRVRVASVTSPRYRIGLAGEPVPVSFEVEYRSPAYARLPVQRGSATRGDLTALRGSRARLLVTFDRDLTALEAALPDGKVTRWRAVTPRRWEGEVPVDREGEYALHATADRGEGRFRYRVTPLADAPPLLAVRLPGGDVDLPAGQQIPVEVFAQDDLGLTQLRLQYRKDADAPWTDLPLARFGDRPREARVASRWDASPLGLLPGETASFRFELLDDNVVSGPGRAVSPTFQLRFPSLAELYERMDDTRGEARTTFEKVADQARELQKSLERLARQTPRATPPSNPSFERSEEMKRALERQQEMGRRIEDAAGQLRKSLDEAAERRAFDEQLTRRLEELNELVRQIQSQEFREALKRMQEAMERMDRPALENELPGWREENQKMLANLERTIELIKKLREEERLQALAQRAEELKAMQDDLNRRMESPESRESAPDRASESAPKDDPALAEEQRRMAEESERLARDAKESAEQSDQPASRESLEEASRELESEAAPSQREAARQTEEQRRRQARQSGQKASESLQRAAKNLRETAMQMQQMQSELDLAAVRRAAQDLLALQRASDAALDPLTPARERGDRQTDLAEGTSRVADSLQSLAQQTPFISPKLSDALTRAVDQLAASGRDLAAGNRGRGEEAGRGAGAALNEAVLELRATEQAMCQNPGAGTPGQTRQGRQQQRGESMERLGQQQSDLNRRSQSLSRRLSEQMRMQSGDQAELERLAGEQQRIREQLSEIRRGEEERQELLGRLDQTEREMKEVEELLREGASDPSLEEKQTRILSRMLDATRSLNRRDFDPEREARPGEDLARGTPSELPPELLRESDRLRLDLLKAEADRYPAQYRSFIEAYLKSLNGSPR